MGLARFITKQFIDIIEWTENGDDVLGWRYPTADFEIQQGAQLIVRDTQIAVFVDEGRMADRFTSGRHTIETRNLPVLTDLRHWTKLFESPFKSEVYFFSTRLRVGQTWGTTQPVTVRDREFGAVRVRAFGVYSFRVVDAERFYRNLSGTRDVYTVADLEGQMRALLGNALAQHLGTSDVSFLDMAANQAALSVGVRDEARRHCESLGLAIEDVQIQSLSLPDELQQRLDERIGMGVVGDLGRYAAFQSARAIPIAAAESGGAAGAGVGLGAGVAMGQTMMQAMAGGQAPADGPASPPTGGGPGGGGPAPSGGAASESSTSGSPTSGSSASESSAGGSAVPRPRAVFTCARCDAQLERATRFCPECGNALVV